MQQSPQDLQLKIEPRVRTLRTLWVGMLFSILLYYGLTLFVGPLKNSTPNSALSLIFVGVAISTTLISVPLKANLLARSVEQQQVGLVQQAYIIAWALTEVAALLGLIDFFLTGDRYYYVLFLISAVGHLLHIPRRQHLSDACFKGPTY